jgi:hypothetical protein
MFQNIHNPWVIIGLVILGVLLVASALDEKGVVDALSIVFRLGTVPYELVHKLGDRCKALLFQIVGPSTTQAQGDAEGVPEHEATTTTQSTWRAGEAILSRNLLLAATISMLSGMISLESERAPLVVFGTPEKINLLPAPIAIAVLVIAAPMLWGEILFEALGHAHVPLFPKLTQSPRGRLYLKAYAILGAVLTLFMGVGIGLAAYIVVQKESWPELDAAVNIDLVFVVVLVGFVLVRALIVGVPGVVGLVAAIGWMVCSFLEVPLKVLADLSQAIETRLVPPIVKVLAFPGKVLCRLPLIGPLLTSALPKTMGETIEVPPQDDWGKIRDDLGIAPREEPEGHVINIKPVDNTPRISVIGTGEVGDRYLELVLKDVGLMGGEGGVESASLLVNGGHADRAVADMAHKLGAWLVGLGRQDYAMAHSLGNTPQEIEALLFGRLTQVLAQRMPKKKTGDVIIIPMHARQVSTFADGLRTLSYQLQGLQHILLMLELPQSHLHDETVSKGLTDFERLWKDHDVLGAVVYDPGSPLVQDVGSHRGLHLVTKTIAGVMLASRHDSSYPSPASALRDLTFDYPLIGIAASSRALLPGEPLRRFDPARWATRNRPLGRGDFEHTRSHVLEMLHTVPDDPQYRSIDWAGDTTNRPKLPVVIAPFSSGRDPRYRQLMESVGTAGGGQNLVIGANGCSDGTNARYFTQVGVLVGLKPDDLQKQPPELPREKGSKSQGPQLLPLPPSSRGTSRRRNRPQAV